MRLSAGPSWWRLLLSTSFQENRRGSDYKCCQPVKLQNCKRRREMETESGRFLSTQFMRWEQLRHLCLYIFLCVTLLVCLSFLFVSLSVCLCISVSVPADVWWLVNSVFLPSLWGEKGCDGVQCVSSPQCACVSCVTGSVKLCLCICLCAFCTHHRVRHTTFKVQLGQKKVLCQDVMFVCVWYVFLFTRCVCVFSFTRWCSI